MQDLEFKLTLAETNLILEALGQLPFVRVHLLISKIQQQAHAQLPAPSDTPALKNITSSQDER